MLYSISFIIKFYTRGLSLHVNPLAKTFPYCPLSLADNLVAQIVYLFHIGYKKQYNIAQAVSSPSPRNTLCIITGHIDVKL